jgi:hypothetical protein
MPWQYQTVPTQNGQANMNGEIVSILQMLNQMGAAHRDLAAVAPLQPGVVEFVFKRSS